MSGTGTGGRIVKDDVLAHVERQRRATARRPQRRPAPPRRPPAEAQPIRGADAALARYMAREPVEIPTATSFRTLSVATLDARRRQLNEALKDAGSAR